MSRPITLTFGWIARHTPPGAGESTGARRSSSLSAPHPHCVLTRDPEPELQALRAHRARGAQPIGQRPLGLLLASPLGRLAKRRLQRQRLDPLPRRRAGQWEPRPGSTTEHGQRRGTH